MSQHQYTKHHQNGNSGMMNATDHNTNYLIDLHKHQHHPHQDHDQQHKTWRKNGQMEKHNYDNGGDNQQTESSMCLHIPHGRYFAPLIMLVGFLLAIILAVLFRFNKTTYTHCRVSINCYEVGLKLKS